jgi:hypothetical protein
MVSVLIFVILLCQCKETDNCGDINLPVCIQNMVEDTTASASLKTIRSQNVKGELHYWLNTDARTYDGAEYIVNEDCDTVCAIGGFRPPMECAGNYNDDWKIVWQK